MSVCLQANQPESRREERGCDLAEHSYYEIVGLHFNSTWPCQGHHMPACLPGLLETRCYWTKAAAPQRHTQQLFSVATYHLMTLTEGKATHDCNNSPLRGNNFHSEKTLATIQTPTTKREIEGANSNVHVQRYQQRSGCV